MDLFNEYKDIRDVSEFKLKKSNTTLNPSNPINDQQDVCLQYRVGEDIKNVSPGNGTICIFQGTDGNNYVLSSSRPYPQLPNVKGLQVSIGSAANVSVSLEESLQEAITKKTYSKFPSLKEFSIAKDYFCNRDYGDNWNMCYLTTIAISKKKYSVAELKDMADSINAVAQTKPEREQFFYGIYELAPIVTAAQQQVAGASAATPVQLHNYLKEDAEAAEQHIIFDDASTAGLASPLQSATVSLQM